MIVAIVGRTILSVTEETTDTIVRPTTVISLPVLNLFKCKPGQGTWRGAESPSRTGGAHSRYCRGECARRCGASLPSRGQAVSPAHFRHEQRRGILLARYRRHALNCAVTDALLLATIFGRAHPIGCLFSARVLPTPETVPWAGRVAAMRRFAVADHCGSLRAPTGRRFSQRRATPWFIGRSSPTFSLFGHSAQRANRSPAIVATRTVGPLGRDWLKMGLVGPRPVYQGVALRWENCWAFGPNDTQEREWTRTGVCDGRIV